MRVTTGWAGRSLISGRKRTPILKYLAVPRGAAFDDHSCRFARHFAKHAPMKLKKWLGFEVEALARVPVGFLWMDDARVKPLRSR